MGCCFSEYDKPADKKPQWFPDFVTALPSMKGKTVVITGTTTGTGFIASCTLAEKGAKVLMLNRESERSAGLVEKVTAAVPDADVSQIICDLSSFASTTQAAKEVKMACPDGIDVLCNNAAVMALKAEVTADGYDLQMQPNHLSHFLLTRELMPLLEQKANAVGDARVVGHSSMARKGPPAGRKYYEQTTPGALGGNGNSDRFERYHQTKLANMLFMLGLDQRLRAKGSKVKSLAAHPGLAATNLQVTTNTDGGMGSCLTGMLMSQSQSAEDGTMGILKCMCSYDVESGELWGPTQGMGWMRGLPLKHPMEKEEKHETDPASWELLWEASEAAVGPFTIGAKSAWGV